jgi:hypothetical protein
MTSPCGRQECESSSHSESFHDAFTGSAAIVVPVVVVIDDAAAAAAAVVVVVVKATNLLVSFIFIGLHHGWCFRCLL